MLGSRSQILSTRAPDEPGHTWLGDVSKSRSAQLVAMETSTSTWTCNFFWRCARTNLEHWSGFLSLDKRLRPNPHRTRDAMCNAMQANGTYWCEWGCLHCTQAASKEKRSNLRRRAVPHPVWIGPEATTDFAFWGAAQKCGGEHQRGDVHGRGAVILGGWTVVCYSWLTMQLRTHRKSWGTGKNTHSKVALSSNKHWFSFQGNSFVFWGRYFIVLVQHGITCFHQSLDNTKPVSKS